jgi:hypothetical protein
MESLDSAQGVHRALGRGWAVYCTAAGRKSPLRIVGAKEEGQKLLVRTARHKWVRPLEVYAL